MSCQQYYRCLYNGGLWYKCCWAAGENCRKPWVITRHKLMQGWAAPSYPSLNYTVHCWVAGIGHSEDLDIMSWINLRDQLYYTSTYSTFAHTWTHMQGHTQSIDWTTYFLIKHPPIVIANPWVSLVPAFKQQLSFPLPHSSPKCFQWRRKQHLPEGYMHMKFLKK